MPLLAIESSGPGISAALAWPVGTAVRVAARSRAGRGQADLLITLIDQLLAEHGIGYWDLELIAAGTGPGSFTGVRTAIAAARGLALASGREVLPLTTFDALVFAAEAPKSGPVAAVLDARRAQVYMQRFNAELRPEHEPAALPPKEAAARVADAVRLVGDGAHLLAPHLSHEIALEQAEPDAGGIARAAFARLAEGARPGPGFALEPCYLRAPDARPMRSLLKPDVAPAAGA